MQIQGEKKIQHEEKKQKISRRKFLCWVMLWYNSGNYYMGDAMGDANNDRVYESKLHEAKLIFRRSSVDHKKENTISIRM